MLDEYDQAQGAVTPVEASRNAPPNGVFRDYWENVP